ncbi:hypothetical protein C7457_0387 [Thermovibrio guaymasensis]|uniref:Lipoprotein n=1 Tax=Thermovibrio guaymasensis TaxID=240167 RepID=A0A420W870_9BACT|nr:hypothetical protein [Thermovibrio guaymasensis]RKQ63513.1 hypothetical protein C7457_0387 [Thermovibrio guaymasensis]
MKFLSLLLTLPLLTGCVPILVAAGAGAAGGYVVGKNYDVKVKSPVEVKKRK